MMHSDVSLLFTWYIHVFAAMQSTSKFSLCKHAFLQVAQLSQRDHAAGYVSYCQKWKTGIGRHIYGYYRSLFNHALV